MDIIGMFRQMFLSLKPENLEKQMKKKGTLKDGAMYIIVSSLFIALLAILMIVIEMFTAGALGFLGDEFTAEIIAEGTLILMIPILVIVIPIIYLIINLIMSGLGFIGCKILGGKGEFENHFYQFAIPGSGLLIIEGIFNFIPCIGDIATIVLGLYFIYITFLIYKGIHKLSNVKAGFLAILPAILILLLVILAVFFFSFYMVSETAQPLLT